LNTENNISLGPENLIGYHETLYQVSNVDILHLKDKKSPILCLIAEQYWQEAEQILFKKIMESKQWTENQYGIFFYKNIDQIALAIQATEPKLVICFGRFSQGLNIPNNHLILFNNKYLIQTLPIQELNTDAQAKKDLWKAIKEINLEDI
jgi:DNA polymerase III psi subunit